MILPEIPVKGNRNTTTAAPASEAGCYGREWPGGCGYHAACAEAYVGDLVDVVIGAGLSPIERMR